MTFEEIIAGKIEFTVKARPAAPARKCGMLRFPAMPAVPEHKETVTFGKVWEKPLNGRLVKFAYAYFESGRVRHEVRYDGEDFLGSDELDKHLNSLLKK